jgi:lipid II:glycine glycyltransferase (peptidoglycan interpeptide bridge formation enzyme)
LNGGPAFRDATPDALADWDRRVVDAPGGHVYQSLAWAEHRRRSGWLPRFLVGHDDSRVLALVRPWPLIGGGSAYIPRGPVPVDTDPATLARRQVAVADALASDGVDVVAADPEVPADATAFRDAIVAGGFAPIDEIQPSRHRVSLPLGPGADEATAFASIAKSTRQRVRAADASAIEVVRHDSRVRSGGAGDGFRSPHDTTEAALDRFYDLLLETGERRGFGFGPRDGFVAWWGAAHAAGHLVYLEARTAAPTGGSDPLIAGLILYRHGGRLSTVHSGDRAAQRGAHPGVPHLLRWRAIQLAIREDAVEMDLGGVDVAGARGEPQSGDALYGLYRHKTSFGGRWLALTGAHERVYDQRGYRLGRLSGRMARMMGRR